MRDQRLAVLALAGFALCGWWNVAPAAPPAPPPQARAALPREPAPTPSPAVAGVRAQLERYAHRTGLTGRELDRLAEHIVREAQRQALDPSLVLAVMHVESRYDTYAVSDKDAMGLMQILPSTGAWLAPRVGVAWRGPHTLFDPFANVQIGAAYLRLLTDRYDGDVATALAAYNWGPGHIDGRLKRGVPLPTEYAQLVLAAYDAAAARS